MVVQVGRLGLVVVVVASLMAASVFSCTQDAVATDPAKDAGALGCGDGFTSTGPTCVPLFSRCKQNEQALPGGGCKRVGAPTTCLKGWSPVKGGWCEPVLPVGECPRGSMAVIGKSSCQPILDCGSGKYGNIKTTAKTIYVDRQYARADADGSKDRPYQSIDEALSAAASGAHIAVAAGEYQEDLVVNKPVTIEGRCPRMVTVKGYKTDHQGTIQVTANNTVIRGLTVTGSHHGVVLYNATKVVVERCAIVDNADPGLGAEKKSGVTLRHSLVARNHKVGVGASDSSTITVESCDIRDTKDKQFQGKTVADGLSIHGSEFIVVDSLISDNGADAGIFINTSQGKILRSVIRRTRDRTTETGFTSSGVWAQAADVIIQDTLIADNRPVGIIATESKLVLERSVIRDTRPGSKDRELGIGILSRRTNGRSGGTLVMKDCTLADNSALGLFAMGGDATLERVLIRGSGTHRIKDVIVSGLYAYGRGTGKKDTVGKLVLKLSNCLLEANTHSGLVAGNDTEVTLDRCTLRSTRRDPLETDINRNIGVGLWVQRMGDPSGTSPKVKVKGSLFERTEGPGVMVLFGGQVTVERSLVRDTVPLKGLALPAVSAHSAERDDRTLPVVTMRCSAIEGTPGVGFLLSGANAHLEQVAVRNTSGPDGDGISVADEKKYAAQIDLSCTLVEKSARAGLIFFGGKGKVCRSLFRKGTYAIVLQNGAAPVICDDNRYKNNQRQGVAFGQGLKPARVPRIPKLPELPTGPQDPKAKK